MLEEHLDLVLETHIDPALPSDAWEEAGLPEVHKTLCASIPMLSDIKPEELAGLSYDDLREKLVDSIKLAYEVREEHVGSEMMRELERQVLLRTIDSKWVDYLHNIDLLREGIHLRGYGQRDPLQEYKREAFEMFNQLLRSIQEEAIQLIFKAQILGPEEGDEELAAADGPNGQADSGAPSLLTEQQLLELLNSQPGDDAFAESVKELLAKASEGLGATGEPSGDTPVVPQNNNPITETKEGKNDAGKAELNGEQSQLRNQDSSKT
jgi:preprotein translocase subunit SecA